MATPAYDMHKNLKDADTKVTQEKWNVYEVLNGNITAFVGLTTFLGTQDEQLKKIPSQQMSAAASTGSGGSESAATAKIDTKSSDEEYKKIYQSIRRDIINNLPCFGALESHLNMAFYQSQEEGTPLRFDSIRNEVMTAVKALKGKADTMLSQHKNIISSKEGALVIKALEKLSKDTADLKEFLEVQIPDAEPIVPGGHTATAVKMG